ncbi:MAG: DNA-binding response regulator, partial [Gammaproteobacteria bacterium]|nr:DNA-binding response regulator [Gammaproteobacteria bacterium]
LRRTTSSRPDEGARRFRYVSFDAWRLDTAARELLADDGSIVSLSTGEFDLLNVFVTHPQVVLSREQLLDLAKGRSA